MADINKANSKANELESIAAELVSIQKNLNEIERRLKAGWSGNAHASFAKAADTVQNSISLSINDIKTLANTVRSNAKQLSSAKG